tara:strand:- start:72 stop:557 length:486 start_codon:yes stop_codon:yes gene_type:complete
MPSAGDNLSLGKLGRAVGATSDYTSEVSLAADGRGSTGTATNMSMFDAGAVGTLSRSPTSGGGGTNPTATMNFTSPGSLFISRIAGRHQNFTWDDTGDTPGVCSVNSNQDYTAQYTLGETFAVFTLTLRGKFHEAGQSDGFNDHVTNYNTLRTTTFSYDGS